MRQVSTHADTVDAQISANIADGCITAKHTSRLPALVNV